MRANKTDDEQKRKALQAHDLKERTAQEKERAERMRTDPAFAARERRRELNEKATLIRREQDQARTRRARALGIEEELAELTRKLESANARDPHRAERIQTAIDELNDSLVGLAAGLKENARRIGVWEKELAGLQGFLE